MPIHVLVTGAESTAAALFLHATTSPNIHHFAGSDAAFAPGIFLVPEHRRLKLPSLEDPAYVPALLRLCWLHRINVLVPCGPLAELLRVSNQARSFKAMGVRLLLSPAEALAMANDGMALQQAGKGALPLPATYLFNAGFQTNSGPWLMRPRFPRGQKVRLVRTPTDLEQFPRDESWLVQEYLPGDGYRVDTLIAPDGRALVAVPRQHLKMERGNVLCARTFHDPEVEQVALQTMTRLGLCWAGSVHLRRDRQGALKVTKVKVHFNEGMSFSSQAGVNLPELCLSMALEREIPESLQFQDVTVARYWTEQVIRAEARGTEDLRETVAA